MADTANFGLELPAFNTTTWHDDVNGNFKIIDALLAKYLSIPNFEGVWDNSIAYDVNDQAVDEDDGLLYKCLVAHTSSASGSFATYRSGNPTHWELVTLVATPTLITGATLQNCVINSLASDLAISDGGTGASTASAARTNLGLGSIATQAASAVAITGGTIDDAVIAGGTVASLDSPIAVADGGTGASTAANARTNLGLGSMATQSAGAVAITGGTIAITGGTIAGITDLAVADGGTGASTAADAKKNLEVFIPIGGGWLTPHKNLRIDYVSATTATATATELWLVDANDKFKRFSNLNVTLNIAGTADAALGRVGVGGAGAAVEAPNTWYHIWAIGKADGTVSAVLSVADPSASQVPSLPTDYLYYGYIGAVRNDNSSNFNVFVQRNNLVMCDSTDTDNQLIIGGGATGMTSLATNTAKAIPTTANAMRGYFGSSDTTAACVIRLAPTSDADLGLAYIQGWNAAYSPFVLPMVSAQTAYYLIVAGDSGFVYCTGWEF